VIDRVIEMNLLTFTVGAAVVGFAVGELGYKRENTDYTVSILLMVGAGMVTLAVFGLLEQPVKSMADTLLICFVEAPEKLQSSASEAALILLEFYKEELGRRCRNASD
jgi:hypothetical protein